MTTGFFRLSSRTNRFVVSHSRSQASTNALGKSRNIRRSVIRFLQPPPRSFFFLSFVLEPKCVEMFPSFSSGEFILVVQDNRKWTFVVEEYWPCASVERGRIQGGGAGMDALHLCPIQRRCWKSLAHYQSPSFNHYLTSPDKVATQGEAAQWLSLFKANPRLFFFTTIETVAYWSAAICFSSSTERIAFCGAVLLLVIREEGNGHEICDDVRNGRRTGPKTRDVEACGMPPTKQTHTLRRTAFWSPWDVAGRWVWPVIWICHS